MKFLERRWVFVALIILFPLTVTICLSWGARMEMVPNSYTVFSYPFFVLMLALVGAFLLETYLLFRFIDLSRWSGGKLWKRAVVSFVIATFLFLAAPILYVFYTGCSLKCDGWRCRSECDFRPRHTIDPLFYPGAG